MTNFILTDSVLEAVRRSIETNSTEKSFAVHVAENAELLVSTEDQMDMVVLTKLVHDGKTYSIGIRNN